MNKLLTKIVGVVLGTTMAVGVGVGVAVNSDRKDIDSQVDAAYSLAYTFNFANASDGSGNPTELTAETALTFLNSASSNLVKGVSSTAKCYSAKGSGGTGIPSKVFKIGTGKAAGNITFSLLDSCDSVSKAVLHVYNWPKKAINCVVNSQTETRASTTNTTEYDLSFEFDATKTIAIEVPNVDNALSITKLELYKVSSGGTLTVTYDANGATSGTVPEDNNTYAANDSVTVLGNTGNLAKTGFTFSGWGTQESGGVVGNSFTITENTTLYAQWTANKYTVSYNGNGSDGGTVPTDNTEYSHNSSATVLGAGTMSYTGHTFVKWNTQADGQGTNYSAGNTITMTSNVTLYAQWAEVEYLSIKESNVIVRMGHTYDVRNNITATGAATLSVTYTANEYFSISNFILTPTKITDSPITITISKAGNVVEPVSYTVEVLKSSEGTEDDPLSIEEAKEIATAAGTTGTAKGYYVAGYIIGEPAYSSKRARIYIGNTSDATETLYVYNMNDFGNENDFASGDLMEGDYVVVLGALKLYNEVPQVCYIQNISNCELVGIDPVNYELSLDFSEKTIYVGESFTLTATDSRPYLGGYEWSTKNDTTNGDFTFSEGSFTAGSTKGSVTIVITSTFDENVTAECVVSIGKKLNPPTIVGSYVKVTSAADLSDGDYLIVYEDGSVAFDGSLDTLDAVSDNISVTIEDNEIVSSSTTDASRFSIKAITGGYSIQSASGYYIGQTSNANGLKASTTEEYVNSISFDNGNADIVSSSAHLRFNSASNQDRFRYYGSSSYTNQQAIQLYKLTEAETEDHKVILCKDILNFLECDEDGITPPSSSEWNQLRDLYNKADFLTDAEKLELKNGTADATIVITDQSSDEDIIKAALAKYDYVLSKYGTDTAHGGYENYMQRTVNPLTAPRISANTTSSTAVTTTVVIISMISLSTLCGYFLLRKRKEEK